MTRLAATLKLEVLNQYRQRFYHASAFVMIVLAILIAVLPPEAAVIVPAILLTNMVVATFAFLGGLLLLEKGERTLEGQIVTPLRSEEYLLSKIVSLSALATVENAVIVGLALAVGLVARPSWGWLLAGSLSSAALYTLLGFLTVIRYNTINEFFMPMVGVTAILEMPALVALGLPEGWWLYLLPTQGPMIMFHIALAPASTVVPTMDPRSAWAMAYAVVYPSLWIGAAFWLGRRALRRFVTGGIGDA